MIKLLGFENSSEYGGRTEDYKFIDIPMARPR